MSAPAGSQSDPYYFISYSRQEATFVDNFSRELEKHGIRNWVDFRNLVPGHPWQKQLDDGVGNAGAILLVVSKASMSSLPVKDEWTKSIKAGKRIILIIFEPCELDSSLAGLEVVDFTRNFKKAMKELIAVLGTPGQKNTAAPLQTGIRMPAAATVFILLSILSILLGILSGIFANNAATQILLGGVPTQGEVIPVNTWRDQLIDILIISLVLLYAPAIWTLFRNISRIRTRKHNAEKIRGAVNRLFYANLIIVVFLLTLNIPAFWAGYDLTEARKITLYYSLPAMLVLIPINFVLYRLLISSSMYRWAGPTGAIIRAARPNLKEHRENGTPLRVVVESAPQDQQYAEELKDSIKKAGHTLTGNLQEADVILSLLSEYKGNSAGDPEKTRLIPVLLQMCNVDKHLSKVQWIDLRYGKTSIEAVANLLDEPDALLPLLGVLPVRASILPVGIKRLNGVLDLLLLFSLLMGLLGTWLSWPIALGIYLLKNYINHRKFNILLGTRASRWLVKKVVRFIRSRKGSLYSAYARVKSLLKKGKFLPYWWTLGIGVVLAVLALFANWEPKWIAAAFVWLIPLLMLQKEVKLWLPSTGKLKS